MQRRHFASAAAMVAGLVVLGGCTTAQTKQVGTQLQYANYAELVRGSPAFRRSEIQKCAANVKPTPAARAEMSKVINLPPNRDPVLVVCQRAVAAMVSGRLSYADYKSGSLGELNPRIIRILQGR